MKKDIYQFVIHEFDLRRCSRNVYVKFTGTHEECDIARINYLKEHAEFVKNADLKLSVIKFRYV
jgi:hypothetical protein